MNYFIHLSKMFLLIFSLILFLLKSAHSLTTIDKSKSEILIDYDYNGTTITLFGAANDLSKADIIYAELYGPMHTVSLKNLRTHEAKKISLPALYYGEKNPEKITNDILYDYLAEKDLYRPALRASVKDNLLFKIFIDLPATAPSGEYKVFFKKVTANNKTMLIAQDSFQLSKVSYLQQIKKFALQYPFLNALGVIFMAIIISTILSFSFKRR